MVLFTTDMYSWQISYFVMISIITLQQNSFKHFTSNRLQGISMKTSNFLWAEAVVTLCKNNKIDILALTSSLNLTLTLLFGLALMLILTQTQNVAQTLTIILKKIKEKTSTHSLLSCSLYERYVT